MSGIGYLKFRERHRTFLASCIAKPGTSSALPRRPQAALLPRLNVPLKEKGVCPELTSELYFLCVE
jgi:hypothetical protein